jgi:hypothetical protein
MVDHDVKAIEAGGGHLVDVVDWSALSAASAVSN